MNWWQWTIAEVVFAIIVVWMDYGRGKRMRVHIEYYGERLPDRVRPDGSTLIMVRDSGGIVHSYPSDVVGINPIGPADWPPRIGDLWRDQEGHEYVALPNQPGEVVLRSIDDHFPRWPLLDEFKKQSPVLIRRRDDG